MAQGSGDLSGAWRRPDRARLARRRGEVVSRGADARTWRCEHVLQPRQSDGVALLQIATLRRSAAAMGVERSGSQRRDRQLPQAHRAQRRLRRFGARRPAAARVGVEAEVDGRC